MMIHFFEKVNIVLRSKKKLFTPASPTAFPSPQSVGDAQANFLSNELQAQQNAIPRFTVDGDSLSINDSATETHPYQTYEQIWAHATHGQANALDNQSSFVLDGDVPADWLLSSDPTVFQD